MHWAVRLAPAHRVACNGAGSCAWHGCSCGCISLYGCSAVLSALGDGMNAGSTQHGACLLGLTHAWVGEDGMRRSGAKLQCWRSRKTKAEKILDPYALCFEPVATVFTLCLIRTKVLRSKSSKAEEQELAVAPTLSKQDPHKKCTHSAMQKLPRHPQTTCLCTAQVSSQPPAASCYASANASSTLRNISTDLLLLT